MCAFVCSWLTFRCCCFATHEMPVCWWMFRGSKVQAEPWFATDCILDSKASSFYMAFTFTTRSYISMKSIFKSKNKFAKWFCLGLAWPDIFQLPTSNANSNFILISSAAECLKFWNAYCIHSQHLASSAAAKWCHVSLLFSCETSLKSHASPHHTAMNTTV